MNALKNIKAIALALGIGLLGNGCDASNLGSSTLTNDKTYTVCSERMTQRHTYSGVCGDSVQEFTDSFPGDAIVVPLKDFYNTDLDYRLQVTNISDASGIAETVDASTTLETCDATPVSLYQSDNTFNLEEQFDFNELSSDRFGVEPNLLYGKFTNPQTYDASDTLDSTLLLDDGCVRVEITKYVANCVDLEVSKTKDATENYELDFNEGFESDTTGDASLPDLK